MPTRKQRPQRRSRSASVPIATLEPKLLTVQAAARYLSATPWFVRTLAWERAVPFVKLGKRLLFDRADLDKFVESRKTTVLVLNCTAAWLRNFIRAVRRMKERRAA